MVKRYLFLPVVVLLCVLFLTPCFALEMMFNTGMWPDSWPKELEPYRESAKTQAVASGTQENIYEIPIKSQDEFEKIWPYILQLTTKGSLVILENPSEYFTTGIRILAPSNGVVVLPDGTRLEATPPWPDYIKLPSGELPEYVAAKYGKWIPWTSLIDGVRNRARVDIILVTDGKAIDPNHISLPPNMSIVDRRLANAWAEESKRTVTIEAFVVEASTDVMREFVYPFFVESKSGMPLRVDTNKFAPFIESLIWRKKAKLLANPRIVVSEGEEAFFKTGGDILYMEKIDYDTFKLKRLTGEEGQGMFVKITPKLTKDGKVSVEYKLRIREVTSRMRIYGAEALNFGMPFIDSKERADSVTLEDGKSQMVSGEVSKLNTFYMTIFGVRNRNETPEITIFVFISQAPKTIPFFELI